MRIVSLVPSATEILGALDLREQIVGVTHSCDYPPHVVGLPRVTSTSIPKDASSGAIDQIVKESLATGTPLYELDVVRIEALTPDLVVTQGVCDVCAVGESQAAGVLAGLSAQPQVLSLHPHRLGDVLDDVLRVGRAAGVPDRAAALAADLQARIERVRTVSDSRTRTSVLILEWIDPLYSCGHWTPEIVDFAGGREVLARPGDRSREVAWDEILEADPEVIVLACCGQDVRRTLSDLALLERKPGYSSLRAVRAGQVYVSDGGAYFSRPGPRLIDALEMLSCTLHGSTDDGLQPALLA